jgi:endoglucanase
MRRTTTITSALSRGTHSLVTIAFVLIAASVAQSALPYTGINISGGEWQDGPFWPNAYEIDYFVSRGMNIFRLPFKWEKLQPTLSGEFDAKFWSGYLSVINYITVTKGLTVIVDPHNYARYNGNIVGAAGGTPLSALTNLWTRLASTAQLKSNPKVFFGLMNEPYSMSTVTWANNANATIKAIRDTGANNLLLVPGNGFTGSSSWTSTYYDTATPAVSNADALKNVYDPLNNYAFEVHTYFDKDRGGAIVECEASPTAPSRFQTVTDWMRTNKRKVFLGEFGGSSQANCLTAFRDALNFLEANSDVWMGWTFWAAGSHFASAFLSGEPVGYPPYTTPQITAILPYMKNAVVAKTYPDISKFISPYQYFLHGINEV